MTPVDVLQLWLGVLPGRGAEQQDEPASRPPPLSAQRAGQWPPSPEHAARAGADHTAPRGGTQE